jgi:hypothetical protein
MPGKHAPASPRSYYVSLARALGAALGAVVLMVVAVVVLLSRGGGTDQAGSPAITPAPTVSTKSSSPRPTVTPSVAPTGTTGQSTLAPAKVTIHVQNGTNRKGLAAQTAAKIRDKGYRVTKVDNTGGAFSKSTIFYNKGAKDEALAFQEMFPEFTVLKEATGTQAEILRVVVGSDYP